MEVNTTVRQKKAVGSVPGTVVYTGDKISENLFIEIFDYDRDFFEEKELDTIGGVFEIIPLIYHENIQKGR